MKFVKYFEDFDFNNPEIERITTKVKVINPDNPEITREYTCLWDTGASHTIISKKIISDLKLEKKGDSKIMTIHGEEKSDVFEISMLLTNHKKPLTLNVSSFDKKDGFDLIIGMDIISHGKLSIDKGKFTFTFNEYK